MLCYLTGARLIHMAACQTILNRGNLCWSYTPSSQSKIRVFSDPTLGKILAPQSNYLSKKGFWATQPLESILVAEFLLCELGVLYAALALCGHVLSFPCIVAPPVHPVSITRFPLRRFSPGAGLLRNHFFTLSTLRFCRGWVRKDGIF